MKTLKFPMEEIIKKYKYDYFDKREDLDSVLINFIWGMFGGSPIEKVELSKDGELRIENELTKDVSYYSISWSVKSDIFPDTFTGMEIVREMVEPHKDILEFEELDDYVEEMDEYEEQVASALVTIEEMDIVVHYDIEFDERLELE